MKTASLIALGLTLWLLTVFHAAAHSTEEVLNDIRQNERYLQITNSVAPDSGINTAKAYRLEFRPTPDGDQMHGVVTHVIDQDGVMRARFHGLKFQPFHLTAFVNTLLYPDHDESWAGAASALLRWWKTSRDRWFMGLLVLSFPLLVVSGLALRRYKAWRRSVAPDSGRPVDATREARDADSSRPDA